MSEPHPPCGETGLPGFAFLNVAAKPKGWNDTSLELLWRYNLHYFDCLCGKTATNDNRSLVLRWIDENPKGSFPGWDPYPTSLRIVNWVKWAAGDGKPAPGDHKRVEASLREQADWLMRHLEYHLLANHLLANAKALVFAGKYLGDGRIFGRGMKIYSKELPEQTCADGVNFERSPMYHCIILEDVLDCLALTGENIFRDFAEKMLYALGNLLGPDGSISMFNDSALGIAKDPEYLFGLAARLGVKPVACKTGDAGGSGFLRKKAGDYLMIAKCGEIGPSYQPGHAHADTYTFELWRGTKKVIGDTGCSTYVPGAVRSYERSTRAHNTVVVDGRDSSEVWASHRVGRRFDKKRHRRWFELTADGLKGIDFIGGAGEHDIEERFHLPPGVSNDDLSIDCPGKLKWEKCDFAEGWNIRKPGLCAVYSMRRSLPAKIKWKIN